MKHSPDPPFWDCNACEKPWPCDPAREELMAETGGGTPLVVIGWNYFEEATLDLRHDPGDELYERFVAWTRVRAA